MLKKIVKAIWVTPGILLAKIIKHWPPEMLGNTIRFWYFKSRLYSLGERTKISENVIIYHPELIKIGKKCYINRYCDLNASLHDTEPAPHMIIGDGCMIGAYSFFRTANHHFTDPDHICAREPRQARDIRKIVVGNDVYIGAHCLILAGTEIGDHCIISGGSVVSSVIPPYSLVAGNPARVIKRLK